MEKEIVTMLSLKNRDILMNELDSAVRTHLLDSLTEACKSILFVEDEKYCEAVAEDFENYKYYSENGTSQYWHYKKNGDIDAIHSVSDLLQSEYYKKHFKYDHYHIVEKHFPDEWKMFIYAGDTHVRGKLPILKSKEGEVMNAVFEHMLRYKRTMGKCVFVDYFHSPFEYLSDEEIAEEYESILAQYKQKE